MGKNLYAKKPENRETTFEASDRQSIFANVGYNVGGGTGANFGPNVVRCGWRFRLSLAPMGRVEGPGVAVQELGARLSARWLLARERITDSILNEI